MKKAKFNWGHGIALFYIVFVGAVVTALVSSFSVDHSLVVDDYYAQDLSYQKQYNHTANSIKSDALTIVNNKETQELEIKIASDSSVKGAVQCYRPSDKTKDFTVAISAPETQISTKSMLQGRWILKIEWDIMGVTFYSEKEVYIS